LVRLNVDEIESTKIESEDSKCRGLYRNLLGDGFLVGWFKLVGFKVLVGRIFFVINF